MKTILIAAGLVVLLVVLVIGVRSIVAGIRYGLREARFFATVFRVAKSEWVEKVRSTESCPACFHRGSLHFINSKASTLDPAEIETIAQLIAEVDESNRDIGLLRSSVLFARRNKPAQVCFRPIGAPLDRHVLVVLKPAGSFQ